MKLEKLRSDIKRWGLARSLFSHIMRRADRYLGIHVHVVRSTAMIENPHYPSIPSGVTLRLIPPDQLLIAISDPELLLTREFVQAISGSGSTIHIATHTIHLLCQDIVGSALARLFISSPTPKCLGEASKTGLDL